jgi:hypothetical protein
MDRGFRDPANLPALLSATPPQRFLHRYVFTIDLGMHSLRGNVIQISSWVWSLIVSDPSSAHNDSQHLSGAEVRGVLLHQGQEWGRVVFDFLS